MVSLHRERFVVVHLYSTFSVDPLNFPLGANLYQKLIFFVIFFVIFEAVDPDFLSLNDQIWHKGADLGLPSPSQILSKIA